VESPGCSLITLGANRSTCSGSTEKRACFELHESVNLGGVRRSIDIYLLTNTQIAPRPRYYREHSKSLDRCERPLAGDRKSPPYEEISGENGGSLIELPMARGTSAPHVVVIQGWKIIMNKRGRMKHLEGEARS
jgi:hypothetical protein